MITSQHLRSFQQELMKISKVLTEADRSHMADKTFAVPASKSNTGHEAYPIPDAQHARSALGFAKMHHDTADYAKVRAKVEKKFPGLVEKKEKDGDMATSSTGMASLPTTFQAPQVGGALKQGSVTGALSKVVGEGTRLGEHLNKYQHQYDLAGLGILAAPSADNLMEQRRNSRMGAPVDKKEVGHSLAELGGLGVLAAPVVASAVRGH